MSRLLQIFGRAIEFDPVSLLNNGTIIPDQIERVAELLLQGRHDSARTELRVYLFENQTCLWGRLAAGAICLSGDDVHGAIEQLNSVYARRPSDRVVLLAMGHCLERLGRSAEAAEFYQDCLKFSRHLKKPRQRLAAIHLAESRVENTIEQYELLRAEYPDDMPTLLTLGHLYTANRRYDDAVEAFDRAILMQPEDRHENTLRVDGLLREGRCFEALEEIQILISEGPEDAAILVKRGDILSALDMPTEAISQYENVLNSYPDVLEARIKLARGYLAVANPEAAGRQFKRATVTNQSLLEAYTGRATALKLSGRSIPASETMSMSAGLAINTAILFIQSQACGLADGQGECTELLENWAGASLRQAVYRRCRQLADRHNRSAEAAYHLALAEIDMGRPQKAMAQLKRAVKLNPYIWQAQDCLIACLFNIGSQADGLAQLQSPNCMDPEILNLYYKTAVLYSDTLSFAGRMLDLDQRIARSVISCEEPITGITMALSNLGLG